MGLFKSLAQLSRFDKPVGTLLLYIPCQWGLFCTNDHLLKYSLLFGIGSFAMRGAGCTINDLWDVKYDKQVTRTRNRPLASQSITQNQAIVWAGAQSLIGLSVLLQLPFQTQLIALSSVPLVLTYPLFKRFTYFPQSILGLTFNYGVLVGYSTSFPIDLKCMGLYLSGWCWTMVYDTIYAHQDKFDDLKIGVKSTALKFGESKTPLYSLTVAQLGLLCAAVPSAWQLNLVAMLFQSGLIYKTDLQNTQSCQKGFQYSILTGLLIALGIYKAHSSEKEEKIE
eukprot:NODE_776_length_3975_cov_0.468008.p2 type:complete len:281 gc:universal NODE_776_length_3975_cov_0.468008:2962-3804(+)